MSWFAGRFEKAHFRRGRSLDSPRMIRVPPQLDAFGVDDQQAMLPVIASAADQATVCHHRSACCETQVDQAIAGWRTVVPGAEVDRATEKRKRTPAAAHPRPVHAVPLLALASRRRQADFASLPPWALVWA